MYVYTNVVKHVGTVNALDTISHESSLKIFYRKMLALQREERMKSAGNAANIRELKAQIRVLSAQAKEIGDDQEALEKSTKARIFDLHLLKEMCDASYGDRAGLENEKPKIDPTRAKACQLHMPKEPLNNLLPDHLESEIERIVIATKMKLELPLELELIEKMNMPVADPK